MKPICRGRSVAGIAMVGELVGYSASEEVVAAWPAERRAEFEVYCERVHFRASDNPVRVPPRPTWLPDPWQGPESGEGVFAGRTGTPLTAAMAPEA